jgi:hypothetical protein
MNDSTKGAAGELEEQGTTTKTTQRGSSVTSDGWAEALRRIS